MTALQYLTVESNNKLPAQYCIIWLHGLGADSNDFAPIVPQLELNNNINIKFIFPNAPIRPITINYGAKMRAWYDIFDLNNITNQDQQGIYNSEQQIKNLIKLQNKSGIDYSNIILAGFSQGGAMALYTGLQFEYKLAGIIALSCYLPLSSTIQPNLANQHTNIFMAHGTDDLVVPLNFGKISSEALKTFGNPVSWHTYPMAHSVDPQEIIDISNFINNIFSQNAENTV